MGAVVIVMAIIGFLVLFAYLKFPPPYADKKLVSTYNAMTMAVCGVLCIAWFFNIRTNWMDTVNDKWWLPVALIGALCIETVFLGVFFLIRNFWLFKPPRRPGGGFGF